MNQEHQPNERGYVVQAFFPTGDPDGVRILSQTFFQSRGLAIPRASVEAARDCEELFRPGVLLVLRRRHEPALIDALVTDSVARSLFDEAPPSEWDLALAFVSARHTTAQLRHAGRRVCRALGLGDGIPEQPGGNLTEEALAEADHLAESFLRMLPVTGFPMPGGGAPATA